MITDNSQSTTAIVLTGTIVPNTTAQLQHRDPSKRKEEYLTAINFYNKFAPVYFLENSEYPLLDDEDFQNLPNTFIRKFPVSNFSEKGRGFQEFEMLDEWITNEANPPSQWLKITGRYIYNNIQDILSECNSNLQADLIINQYKFSGFADPAIFYITSTYYQRQILGLYRECDDATGWFIEKALYRILHPINSNICQRFRTSLVCSGLAGVSGQKIQSDWRNNVNQVISPINYLLDRKYIWLSV
jgi:hypothetical protein